MVADLEHLQEALAQAHKKGEKQHAQILADAIREQQSEGDVVGGLRTLANATLWGGGSEVAGLTKGAYGLGRGLVEGRGLGEAWDIASGMYGAGEQEARAAEKAFAERNPKTALGLTLAGGAQTALPAAMIATPGAGSGIAAKAAGGAAAGLLEGSVGGALFADPGERAEGAVIGGGLGLTAGALSPVIVGALAAPARMAYHKIASKFGHGSTRAQDYLARALLRDGLTPEQALQKVREIGPGAALVDVGPNLGALGEAAAQRPGQALTKAVDFATERRGRQMSAIAGALDDAIGPRGRMVMQRVEDAPAFKEILQRRYPVPREFSEMLHIPDIQKAYRKARTNFIRRGGDPAEAPDFKELRDMIDRGEITELTVDLLHKVKIGLDGVIEPMREAQKKGMALSVDKDDINALNDLRARFRQIARNLDADYGASLDRMSAEFGVDNAYKAGLDVFKPKFNVKAAQKGLDERELRAFRQGVADASIAKVSGTAELGGDATSGLLRQRERLEDAFGARGKALVDKLKTQREFRSTENRMFASSRTGFRKGIDEDMAGGVSPSELADATIAAAHGVPPISAALRAGGRYLSGRAQGRALDELADPIFAQSPGIISDYLRGTNRARALLQAQNIAGQGLLSVGAYGGAYQQGNKP